MFLDVGTKHIAYNVFMGKIIVANEWINIRKSVYKTKDNDVRKPNEGVHE